METIFSVKRNYVNLIGDDYDMKKSLLMIVMVLALLLSLAACGSTEPVAQGEPKHTLTYLGGEVKTVEPNPGDPHTLVCVYTEYTNNSGETALPADNVNVKAFQHGVEIPIMVFTGTKIDGCIQCDTAVQSGVTAKVIWTFQPQDESEISIELSTGDKYSISGAVADVSPWPITDTPVKLRYDRMWIYGAYAETEDAAIIADIIAAVNALKVGEPSDVFFTDYTDILTFTFADGTTLRLEFEEYNWAKSERERYHVDGLSPLRNLLDRLIEEKQEEVESPLEEMRIKITAGDHTITAVLYDNAAGRALWGMLPLTLPMENLYGREMCYRFGAGTLPEDEAADTGYKIGDISYWPPRGSLVILYKQNGEVFEQQPIGHTDDDISFFDGMPDTDITFERVE